MQSETSSARFITLAGQDESKLSTVSVNQVLVTNTNARGLTGVENEISPALLPQFNNNGTTSTAANGISRDGPESAKDSQDSPTEDSGAVVDFDPASVQPYFESPSEDSSEDTTTSTKRTFDSSSAAKQALSQKAEPKSLEVDLSQRPVRAMSPKKAPRKKNLLPDEVDPAVEKTFVAPRRVRRAVNAY